MYDPTCGSGSLLLKVGEEAAADVTLFGQEKDEATSGLAQMNMVLHGKPGAKIEQGNTLTDPKFRDGDALKTFDYVVANPPFSDKRWSTGLDPLHDLFERFKHHGVPPAKQGDYGYLLHIVRSLKSTGTAACILPHGVLFRGNAEAEIRKSLVRRGLIKGLIGLPANLFYGTGIPACIVVIDKKEAAARVSTGTGIFMIDASQGFMKDGPKNRLRERDIHRIVDVFTHADESDPRYARQVPFDEIERNDFNLNLPRYIDSAPAEDRQDIEAHLKGGIPAADVQALAPYWAVCPQLEAALFRPNRPGYVDLTVEPTALKATIHQHPEFRAFIGQMNAHFAAWRTQSAVALKTLEPGFHPKALIAQMSESLLAWYQGQPLIDPYAVYQHAMDYWAGTMQDDCYLIAADGWRAVPYRVIETKKGKDGKPGRQVDKGWACDLVPKALLVARYFAAEQAAIDRLAADLEAVSAKLGELEEEHGGEDAVFSGFDRINDASVKERVREIAAGDDPAEAAEEVAVLEEWLVLSGREAVLSRELKSGEAKLDAAALARYATLTEAEVRGLVVDKKWLAALDTAVHDEMNRVSQALAKRVGDLAERYETPLAQLVDVVTQAEMRTQGHLAAMGFTWKIKQGAMQEFFRDQRRPTGVTEAWQPKPIALLGRWFGGMTPSMSNPEYWQPGTVPWLTSGDVKTPTLKSTALCVSTAAVKSNATTVVPKGSVVLVTRSGILRRYLPVAMTEVDMAINQDLKALVPGPDISGPFVMQAFQYLGGTLLSRCMKTGTTVESIHFPWLKAFQFLVPPLAEQTAIATTLSDMDAEITALEARLAKARALKQGMAQALLTGRIRLV